MKFLIFCIILLLCQYLARILFALMFFVFLYVPTFIVTVIVYYFYRMRILPMFFYVRSHYVDYELKCV